MQNTPFQLSPWQKAQVTLLYHFASLDYLKGLQQRLQTLLAWIDPTLDLAKLQRRDELLTDARWGTRNTSQNWANNGWAFLADFELSTATDIANRAFESYAVTGVNQCARGMAEFSLDWMTPDEQDEFESRFKEISLYAHNIDETMNLYGQAGRWNDFTLALARREYPEVLAHAPALRLRSDVTCATGTSPIRTGVYLPIDDPYGTPQFCWTGGRPGTLLECNTFNDLGLMALTEVGRTALWVDDDRMYAFVQNHLSYPSLAQDRYFNASVTKPKFTPSLVAGNAFTTRPCKWIYVEQIHGQLEDWTDNGVAETGANGPRVPAGTRCQQPGYYFTPAKADSRRHFASGELMPHVGGDYGATIWQWDLDQADRPMA